jgi:hypothetical protein
MPTGQLSPQISRQQNDFSIFLGTTKISGRWFGTMEFYDFPYIYCIGNVVTPSDYFFRGVGIPPTRNISAVGFRQFLVSVKFLLGRNESHHDCMMIGQFCSPTLGRFWRLHLLQGHQLDSKQIHQAHHDTHSCICFSHFSLSYFLTRSTFLFINFTE